MTNEKYLKVETGKARTVEMWTVESAGIVMLEVTATDTERCVVAGLTNAEAHEIAQWILANVPEPESQTLIDWAKIPVGGQFGFGKYEPEGPGVYVKDGEWSYRNRFGGHRVEDIRDSDPGDLSRGLTHHRPALPTNYAAVVKTPDGTLYTRADGEDPAWLEYNTTGEDWVTDSYLIERGYKVIFEGVDL